MPSTVEAPIVAVTVYPHHARITRRASARLDGETRFAFAGLPWNLDTDSVRVTGSGPAVIAGVDVTVERHPVPADASLRTLTERRRTDQAVVDEVADAVSAETAKVDLLTGLATRSGKSFAKALAAGTAEPPRVAEVTDALGIQLAEALGKRRELGIRLARLRDDLKALDREIEAKQGTSEVDSATVTVELEGQEDGAEIGLELSYVVANASWEPGYDVRVRGEDVAVTWYGRITQHTGEDWPECELALSTARPANTVEVPELEPWFLDRVRPIQPLAARAAYGSASPAGGGIPESARMPAPSGRP
ncbi:mucoidy inhibitor MuiA family protein, partial [Amycolatopsis thailandensis]|uniref:mucoidy inhibitor MuiA family protein n=1 Tax=Amycolatopsis thailandensis TaxID=589330 RepID=UPI001178529C